MKPVVVADVGGTNARFGVVGGCDPNRRQVSVEHRSRYLCADFPDFASVFEAYLDGLRGEAPGRACVAVAGPVRGDRVSMTNLGWTLSATELAQSFGLDRVELINDFSAQAYATLFLGPGALSTVCQGETDPKAPRCILGPGTGLGVAAIVPVDGRWVAVPGEGGHVTLASTGCYESRLIQQMSPVRGTVSAESVLSGPGLLRLYRAVCAIEGHPGLAATAAEITRAALAGSDPAAAAAYAVFFRLLGGMLGDLILTFGATGGAFLSGGILPRVESLLKDSEFEYCLRSKGVMGHYLENVGVELITVEDAALTGAAAWACREAGRGVRAD